MSISWGQLIAASGLVAIAYTNREPAADLDALLQHVRHNAAALGIDRDRIGVWACSGSVPLALSALMTHGRDFLKCGALLYGYMLDLDGAVGVAQAAATFRFTNPHAGTSFDDLREDLPLLIARAGQEQFPRPERLDRPLLRKGAGAEPAGHADQPCGRPARLRSAGRQRHLAPDHPAGAGFPDRSADAARLPGLIAVSFPLPWRCLHSSRARSPLDRHPKIRRGIATSASARSSAARAVSACSIATALSTSRARASGFSTASRPITCC